MPKRTLEADYARRILRVAEHLEAHLDEDLSLDRLAEVGCLSRFHFHRIWRAHTGETVAETVVRLRLMRASGEIAREGLSLSAIARRAGYGSQAAFTRAFVRYFGTTPGALRRRTAESEEIDVNAELEIIYMAPIRCAAIAHRGPYTELGTAFGRLVAWAMGAGIPVGTTRVIGVAYDDPKAVAPQDLRSHACIELPDGREASPPAESLTIASGRHAVYRHVGPYGVLTRAYSKIYGDLLPKAGLVPGDRPPFEIYLNDARVTAPADLITDIHIPIDG